MLTGFGATCLQISCAIGHRVRNRQPLGIASGEGISPPSDADDARRRCRPGWAASNAAVYGWLGRANTAEVGPDSTMLPRYMTWTKSATCAMTARSCEMKTIA